MTDDPPARRSDSAWSRILRAGEGAARSLRVRLLAGAMAAFFVALAIAWLALTWMFERHIERREAIVLTETAEVLIAGLRIGPGGEPIADQRPSDARFDRLAGGRYWELSAPWGVLASRSLWDQGLPRASDAPTDTWRTRIANGPFNDKLLIVERRVRPDPGGPAVLVQVAQNEASLRTARREFGVELAASLAILWGFLSIAAWFQVNLGLRPLAQVRDELVRLRRSPSARLPANFPREVEPLTGAINDLAEAREADLGRARKRAADLAHSLKTPLAALAAQSRRAREAGAVAAAEGLDHAIAAMGAALEAELARARAAAARNAAAPRFSSPLTVAERVVGVVERTESGARIVFEIEIDPTKQAPLAADDLAEILGALIENAARFARRRVRIADEATAPGQVKLVIEDDGVGIEEGRAEAALMRGGRLDEAGPGHGLGLAIVTDLVEATEGSLSLERAELGGLRVAITWSVR